MTPPPQRPPASTSIQDRQLPEAFAGETVTRRRFINRTAQAAGVIAAAAVTLPALGFAIGPVFAQTPDTWQHVGPVSRFTSLEYVPEVIKTQPTTTSSSSRTVYVKADSLLEVVGMPSQVAEVLVE